MVDAPRGLLLPERNKNYRFQAPLNFRARSDAILRAIKEKRDSRKERKQKAERECERKEEMELNKEKLRLPHVGSFSGRAVMRFPSLFRALQFCPEIYSVLRSVVGRAAW